jgi:hypothetical protein
VADKGFGFPAQVAHNLQKRICEKDVILVVQESDLYPGFIVTNHTIILMKRDC